MSQNRQPAKSGRPANRQPAKSGRSRSRWVTAAGRCAGLIGFFGWTAASVGAPSQAPRDAHAFDLAVESMDAKQLSSTSMFREVEILCVVTNKGPKWSGPASVTISRPGDDKPKVLKKISLGELAPGAHFDVRAETAAWFNTAVAYRCEIQLPGAGDADASDNTGEVTYPKS